MVATRERLRRWLSGLKSSGSTVDRQNCSCEERIADLEQRVAVVETKQRTLASDLSTVPTVEEVATWQASVEQAQAAANAELRQLVEQLRPSIDGDDA